MELMREKHNPFGTIKHKPGCNPPYKYNFSGDEFTGNQTTTLGGFPDACGKGYVTCQKCGEERQIHWSATGRYEKPTLEKVTELLENNGF